MTIKEVQTALNLATGANLVVDGVFGKKSRGVMSAFQKANNLSGQTNAYEKALTLLKTYLEADRSELILTPNVTPLHTRINECKGVVFHHTCGNYAGSVSWCLNTSSKVSYHAICSRKGALTRLATDKHVAWHAGESTFRGRRFCNSFTLGFAFELDTNTRSLTDAELSVMIEWLKPRALKYKWTLQDMVSHREVSKGRKDDPSPKAMQQILQAIRGSNCMR